MNKFEKKIVGRLQAFADTVKSGKKIGERFDLHTVELNLCPTAYDPAKIVATRKLLDASQLVFAKFLGVNVKTVRSWEQGVNVPSDMACRFMDEIRENVDHWRSRLRDCVHFKAKKKDVVGK